MTGFYEQSLNWKELNRSSMYLWITEYRTTKHTRESFQVGTNVSRIDAFILDFSKEWNMLWCYNRAYDTVVAPTPPPRAEEVWWGWSCETQ